MEINVEKTILKENTQNSNGAIEMIPLKTSLDDELGDAAKKLEKKQKAERNLLQKEKLKEFAIKGTEADWENALSKNKSTIVSVKR